MDLFKLTDAARRRGIRQQRREWEPTDAVAPCEEYGREPIFRYFLAHPMLGTLPTVEIDHDWSPAYDDPQPIRWDIVFPRRPDPVDAAGAWVAASRRWKAKGCFRIRYVGPNRPPSILTVSPPTVDPVLFALVKELETVEATLRATGQWVEA